MTEIIMGQVRFVIFSACLGMLLMAGYDVVRFLRWMFPQGKWLVAIGDLLFWCVMSIPAYAVFFIYNDGAIRWYGVLAVLSGGLLYEYGISRPVRLFGRKHVQPPVKKIKKIGANIRKKCCKKKANSI
ncbi:MAG: spore cortex biosynthesis protein YabQ [Clostridiaceae bacterium]|nr:spore cortex biosynthesis protein YabQ [Clostridiaceae bacterium]